MSEEMTDYTVFTLYPFFIGEKIKIEGGARKGDWEVVGLDDKKVRLRCPVSHREFEFNRFTYLVEKRYGAWPDKD